MQLLADYFGFIRGAPNNGIKPARTMVYPWTLLAPEDYGPANKLRVNVHVRKAALYWEHYIKADPAFATWLSSGQALTSPSTWFGGCPFPAHLTPRIFAEDVLPNTAGGGLGSRVYGGTRYKNWTYNIEGLHELAAYAHNWPLTPYETDKARDAARALMGKVPFILYALVNGSHLPMPFGKQSYFDRVAKHQKLSEDPLGFTEIGIAWHLPDWASTPKDLLRICPEREKVAGSSKKAYLIPVA